MCEERLCSALDPWKSCHIKEILAQAICVTHPNYQQIFTKNREDATEVKPLTTDKDKEKSFEIIFSSSKEKSSKDKSVKFIIDEFQNFTDWLAVIQKVIKNLDVTSVQPIESSLTPTPPVGGQGLILDLMMRQNALPNKEDDSVENRPASMASEDLDFDENVLYESANTGPKFEVTITETEASKRCQLSGKYDLLISSMNFCILDPKTSIILYVWPFRYLRRYGRNEQNFTFEAGRRCPSGPGLFSLSTDFGNEIFEGIVKRVKEIKDRQQKEKDSNKEAEAILLPTYTKGANKNKNAVNNETSEVSLTVGKLGSLRRKSENEVQASIIRDELESKLKIKSPATGKISTNTSPSIPTLVKPQVEANIKPGSNERIVSGNYELSEVGAEPTTEKFRSPHSTLEKESQYAVYDLAAGKHLLSPSGEKMLTMEEPQGEMYAELEERQEAWKTFAMETDNIHIEKSVQETKNTKPSKPKPALISPKPTVKVPSYTLVDKTKKGKKEIKDVSKGNDSSIEALNEVKATPPDELDTYDRISFNKSKPNKKAKPPNINSAGITAATSDLYNKLDKHPDGNKIDGAYSVGNEYATASAVSDTYADIDSKIPDEVIDQDAEYSQIMDVNSKKSSRYLPTENYSEIDLLPGEK
ncbi:unnamed protein product [Owenia fusiformis]|uniref:IRS-type PTB domain-containing protein n=1 Tax=Owenia fusiformis TaxID=6347 RepID=A0A8S4NQY1_OWEFU|nr:unnamed protein product [Owenia fusiformis]